MTVSLAPRHLAAAVMALGLMGAGAAHARTDLSVAIGLGVPTVVQPVQVYGPPPVYVQPAPVYVQPAPVYVQPRPVYAPPPVYVQPTPVYIQQPAYGWVPPGHRWGHGHGHRRWDDDDRDYWRR